MEGSEYYVSIMIFSYYDYHFWRFTIFINIYVDSNNSEEDHRCLAVFHLGKLHIDTGVSKVPLSHNTVAVLIKE